MIPSFWRYWLDGRALLVFLLFIIHSCMVYKSAINGSRENEENLHYDAPLGVKLANYMIQVGPMYTFRVHFLSQQQLEHQGVYKEGGKVTETLMRSVAPSDCLILYFADDVVWNQTDMIEEFSRTRRWPLVLPLRPSRDSHLGIFHSLPKRPLLSRRLGNNDVCVIPVPLVIRLGNISGFLSSEITPQMSSKTLEENSIVACFLVEADPAFINIPGGGTLEDELSAANQNKSRIPIMVQQLRRIHGASWAFFLSPCRSNRVYSWDQPHFSFLNSTTMWWVCVSSDALIEVNTAAQLLTMITD